LYQWDRLLAPRQAITDLFHLQQKEKESGHKNESLGNVTLTPVFLTSFLPKFSPMAFGINPECSQVLLLPQNSLNRKKKGLHQIVTSVLHTTSDIGS
jgi:hypothetical protein